MDYLQELENVKNWIKNLLIVQYRQAKKNRALIDVLVEVIFAKLLPLQIRDLCLNVDESVGKQLDVVGKWVGIDRFYNAIDIWKHPYVSFISYSQFADSSLLNPMQGGFSTYTNFADNDGGFLMYKEWQETRTADNQIGDDDYRQLIKLKIIKNSINHTMKNIDKAIYEWSGGKVYTTWNTMEVTYHYNSDMKILMTLADYKNVLPHPTGCSIVLTENV